MSYCRKNEGSDLYVYSTGFEIICQECMLVDGETDAVMADASALLSHLDAHLAAGHKVSPEALERAQRESSGGRTSHEP